MPRYILGERFVRLKPGGRQIQRSMCEKHIDPFWGTDDIERITQEGVQQFGTIL